MHRQREESDYKVPCICTTIYANKIGFIPNRNSTSSSLDTNYQAQSYTQLKINKPYIALNEETYISLHPQELNTRKRIGYDYFCEELFVVKSKNRYSCASTIYFNLGSEIIKENCEFNFFFNKTDVKPAVLEGGYQIILMNWPSYKQ